MQTARNALPAALLALAACSGALGREAPTAAVAGVRYKLEVADTPAKQERGLGYRDALAEGTAMYFPYARAGYHSFWMKGMRFDIDIVWIREERIVHIESRVPAQRGEPESALKVYRPRAPADAVIEVNAGEAEKRGWKIGDRVEVRIRGKP